MSCVSFPELIQEYGTFNPAVICEHQIIFFSSLIKILACVIAAGTDREIHSNYFIQTTETYAEKL